MEKKRNKVDSFKNDKKNDIILLNNKYKYCHAERRCLYRSEEFEISCDEAEEIKKLQNNSDIKYDPYKEIISLSNEKPVKIILDTDIGTDIDDVLTLLLLSHLKKTDVELIGITTNYRPTVLRKYIAECILKETKNSENDLSSIPVIAGNCYLCGTHRPFYYAGNEGKGLGINQNDNELIKKYWNNIDNENAEDFIYQNICKYPKQITIVSIGIPTNIGNLITKYGENKVESLIGHIVVMGGGSIINSSKCNKMEFNDLPKDTEEAIKWIRCNNKNVIHLFPNHNLSGDTLASVMMFKLKCPISLIPHHITKENILKGKVIETLLLLATKSDIDKQIYEENENGICGCLMTEWFKVRGGQRCQCLHDPLTLYEAIYCKQSNDDNKNDDDFELEKESSLRYCNGTIIVHQWAAFISFIPHKNGPHRFAFKCINKTKWIKWAGDIMINNVSKQNITDNAADYMQLINVQNNQETKQDEERNNNDDDDDDDAPFGFDLDLTQNDSDDGCELPPNWIVLYTDDGIPYYHNEVTKVTQWNVPE